jgi:hypothetical protein
VGSSRVTAWLDADGAALAQRLLRLAMRGLPRMYLAETDEFCFTRAPATSGGSGTLENRGTSLRYAAIVALGAYFLDEAGQRTVLSGRTVDEYLPVLIRQAGASANLGDIALVTWAAAQAGHDGLGEALGLLRERDTIDRSEYVVESAWVISALAASRGLSDVEIHLRQARSRLLNSVVPGSPLFPHSIGPGLVKSYRAHVACFADQVYPIQALARLHRSGDDAEALRAAEACAAAICRAQGDGGQWWWHYDSRTGAVIEGYPVYTVHQHAMAPMALIDLAEAGGTRYDHEIRRGLAWITDPAELATGDESMVGDDEGVTWRKIFRGDPHKVVRGLQTVTTRAIPGLRIPGVGLVYKPTSIDRECRPYEFGWLLFTWLGGIDGDKVGQTVVEAVASPQGGLTE